MKLNEFLPFTIVKNGKQMIQDVRSNGQRVVNNAGEKTGMLDRMRAKVTPKSHYQLWIEGAAERKRLAQERYDRYRGR